MKLFYCAKYYGEELSDIAEKDLDYLIWLFDNLSIHEPLYNPLIRQIGAIMRERNIDGFSEAYCNSMLINYRAQENRQDEIYQNCIPKKKN